MKKSFFQSTTRVRDYYILKVVAETGAKLTEVLDIKYKDYNFKERCIKLNNRVVYISNDTAQAINLIIQFNPNTTPDSYIFQTKKGGKVCYNHILKVFNITVNKLKEEGLIPKNKRIVLYTLRYSLIKELLNNNVPVDAIIKYIGIKDIHPNIKELVLNNTEPELIKHLIKQYIK